MTRPTTTASNLFRRSLCPGSARMEAGLPEEDSAQAIEGRFLHEYYAHPEWVREDIVAPSHKDLLDRADELTKQSIETVEKEIDVWQPRENSVKDYRETNLLMLGSKIAFEGRPDLVRYYLPGEAAIILDLKFGYLNVEPADVNLQLRSYAVLSYDFSPTKVIYVGIIQPRLSGSEALMLAKYYPDDIEDARQQIISILEASEKPDAPIVPGEVQCRYCKAARPELCPAFAKAMQVPAVLTPEKALSKAARTAYLEQRVKEFSDEQLSKAMLAIQLAGFCEDVVHDEVRKRGDTDYWTIAKESAVRGITNVRKAMALVSLAGFTDDEKYECVTKMPIKNIEDVLHKKHPTWDWKQVRDWINEKLKSVIETETKKARVLRK